MKVRIGVILRIEKEIGWCRLWDCGRDWGPQSITGLIRILTHPAHANDCSPKYDVGRLGEGGYNSVSSASFGTMNNFLDL